MFGSPDNAVMCVLARRQVCHKSASMLMCGIHSLCNSEYCKYGWFAPTYRQCQKQFNELKRWYSCFNLHCELKFNASDLVITCLDTNSQLYFFSLQEPDNIRGETLSGAFVDEAAFVSDEGFGVVLPMLDVERGFLVCASTPWMKKGMFWGLFNDEHSIIEDWTKYDLSECVSKERLEFYKRTLSPTLFKADILGEWLDDGESLLYGNIGHCIGECGYGNEPLTIGIDVATGTNDYCAVSAFYMRDGVACELFTERFRNGDVTSNVVRMYDIISGLNVKVVLVETNSVGLPVYQLLKRKCKDSGNVQLASKLREDYWTGQSKGQAISDSVLWFNSDSIRIHTPILVSECQSYTEIVGKDGKISFGNAHQGDRDYHDDCWCAALHALSGIRKGSGAGKYILG